MNEDGRTDGTASSAFPARWIKEEGLTIVEAATYLEISERTVRSRIKAGKLAAVQIERPQGYEWRVYPAGLPPGTNIDPPTMQPGNHVDPPVNNVEASELARLLERAHAENQQLAGQLGFMQARLQEAEKTIALLTAPKDGPDDLADVTPAEASVPHESGPNWQAIAQALEERVKRLEEPPAEPEPKRSWWKWWR
jgi:excisionase family DNA binding protein